MRLSPRLSLKRRAISVDGGGSYPDVIVARSKQTVWDLSDTANTGPRSARTNTVTNAHADGAVAGIAGSSIATFGSQKVLFLSTGGITLSNWRFEIPIIVKTGSASAITFNDCEFCAAGIVGNYSVALLTNGYDPFNASSHENTAIVLNYCSFTYADRVGAANLTEYTFGSFLLVNGTTTPVQTANTSMTVTRCRFEWHIASLVSNKGVMDFQYNYLKDHGAHATLTNAFNHSEGIYAFYGTNTIANNLFAPTNKATRVVNTWTGHIFLAAEFGTLNYDVYNNVCIGTGQTGNTGSGTGDAVQFRLTGTGTNGTNRIYDNVLEKSADTDWFRFTGMASTNLDKFVDHFDYASGTRITQFTEIP